MRNGLFTSIMLAGFALALATTPSFAIAGLGTDPMVTTVDSGPDVSVYGGERTKYIAAYFGMQASRGPTTNAGFTLNWDHPSWFAPLFDNVWGDWWNSFRNHRNDLETAKEADVTIGGDGSTSTFVGPIDYEATASYWFLSFHDRDFLATLKDDGLYQSFAATRPFKDGKVTFGITGKVEAFEGINEYDTYVTSSLGVSADFKALNRLFGRSDSVDANLLVAQAVSLTGNSSNSTIGMGGLTYHPTDWFTINVTGQALYFKHHLDDVWMLKFSYALGHIFG